MIKWIIAAVVMLLLILTFSIMKVASDADDQMDKLWENYKDKYDEHHLDVKEERDE
jgi:hypothetical protein